MANGDTSDRDKILQEIRGGRGGTAVAEPPNQRDSILAEIRGEKPKVPGVVPSPGAIPPFTGTLEPGEDTYEAAVKAQEKGDYSRSGAIIKAADKKFKARRESTYPVDPLKGTQVGAFPSPAAEIQRQVDLAKNRIAEQRAQRELHPTEAAFMGGEKFGTTPTIFNPEGMVSGTHPGAIHLLKDLSKDIFGRPLIHGEMSIPDDFVERYPVTGTFLKSLMGAVSGIVSPANIAIAAGLGALPAVAGAAPVAIRNAIKVGQLGATGYFTKQFLGALYQDVPQFARAVEAKDWKGAAGIAGDTLPNVVFAWQGIRDFAEAGMRVREGIKERAEAKRQYRADTGLPGEVAPTKAEVVPPEEEIGPTQPATKAPEEAPVGAVPREPEPARAAEVPKEPAKPEPKPAAEELQSFENKEEGTRARVVKVDRGYSVTLVDTESGEVVPQARIFKTPDAAAKYAQSLVAPKPAKSAPEVPAKTEAAPTPTVPEEPPSAPEESLARVGEAGPAVVRKMYMMLADKLAKGDLTEGGQPSRLLQAAKAAGVEATPEALREFATTRYGKPEPPAPAERRITEGAAPEGIEERRGPLKKLSEMQAPPYNQLKVINERLAEPGLPERDRRILEEQKADLIEHPEDIGALRDTTLAEIRAAGKAEKPIAKVPEEVPEEAPKAEEPTAEIEPETPPIELLRAEAKPSERELPDWVQQGIEESGAKEASGRWFTDKKDLLDWYNKDAGPGAVTKSLRINAKEAEKYRVSNLAEDHPARRFSRDPENEFFVPRELADQAKEAPPIDTGAEERTMAAEEPEGAPERIPAEEPTPAEIAAGEPPVGERDEGALEGAPSEAVRGVTEERPTAPESGEGRGPDAGRVAGPGEPGGELRPGVGGREGEAYVPPERGRPAGPRREPGQQTSGTRAGHDYHITEADEIGAGGIRSKYRNNLSAIRTLKAIEVEGRLATPEEQATLVKYVGWGGMPQAFDAKARNWSEQYQELLDALNPDEYSAARASTPNAHYTSPVVISAMWNALQRLGYKDGRMLEPSAGVGHFLGLMPADLAANTAKVAIELDSLTGRILKQLYQTADARIQGFEKFNGRDGTFDIAVGNVPFGDFKVHDPAYDKHNLNIHNYFILKSLDKLRPGGVAALITSNYTLDALDPKARNLFAERADLLGAIRLPNTAFKGNANTEVTTDILFFQKREPGQKQEGHDFEKTQELDNGIRVNEYFAKHPYMMLGEMQRAGTMYAADTPALIAPEDQDFPAELQKAVEKLPENVLTERKVPESVAKDATVEAIPAFGDTKQYGLKVTGNKVYRRIGEEMTALADYPKDSVPVLKGMLGVRDAVRELFEAEGKGRSTRETGKLRERLNNAYDQFTQKHGLIHNKANERAMQYDPDLPLLLSLEEYDPKTKTAKKADVFSKPTIAPRVPVERVETAKESMLVSLADKGTLDFEHMAKLTGKSPAELQQELRSEGLVFHNPDGSWEATDAYLSGNVRKKLMAARDAAAKNPEFADNVKALEAVQPADLEPSKIHVRLGSSWVPKDVIKDFIGHILNDPAIGRDTAIQHVSTMGLWSVSLPYYARYSAEATAKWGTERANAMYILEQGLNLREPVVYDRDANDKPVLNQKETLAAQAKLEELNAEFKRWMLIDSEHAADMVALYNHQFNAEVERNWDGSHLTLPGVSIGVKLRPHQMNQIWRNINGGNQLIAHEVGTGKTYIMIGTAMEWRRLGRARKPLMVVPNNMVQQISRDFLRMYPQANVLAADKKSFEADKRKEFTGRIATGDWDAVVMAHSQFGLLGVSDEMFNNFMHEQISAARAMLSEVSKEEGKRGKTVKQIEKDIKRMEVKIVRRAEREIKDNTVNFETLGVDGLIVDEAHNFKRLWFPTKLGRVPGVPTGDSNRAMDMYLKSRYISRLNNGKNVIFATGTPISNTMAEMYVMQKYLDEQNLKDMGMEHFDSWAANFGEKQTKLESRPENPAKMRMHTRFSRFVNVPEVTKMFRRTADIKTVAELGLPRPKLNGGVPKVNVAQASQAILDYVKELSERAEKIKGKPPEPGGDNMLKITTDGRKATTDLRLIDPNAEDDPGSKVNKLVDNVAKIYHEQEANKGTQLIFLDMGVPNEEGRFDLYADIKRKLVGRGIPASEVRFMQEAKNDEQKQAMFDATNEGTIRVLMGSTPLLGVGVNVQRRLYAGHHLDAPMRPSDIEQRDGRFLRQGNMNPEVEEHRYVTQGSTEEGSFDTYVWQLLENKAKFIGQVMRGDPSIREMEDSDDFALSAAEIKAIASGNPLFMKKVQTDAQLQKLSILASAHASQQFDNKARLARLPEEISHTQKAIEDLKADQTTLDQNKTEKFQMTIGKSSFTERKDAGAAINEAVAKNGGKDPKRIGQFAGMEVWARGNMDGFVKGRHSYFFTPNMESPLGTVQSLESSLRGLDAKISGRERDLERQKKEQVTRQAEVGKPFPRQAELEKLLKQKQEIDAQLDVKNRDVGAVTKAEEDQDEKDDRSGEKGFATLDMLTFGLPSLYRKIMASWRRVHGQGEAQEVPKGEDTGAIAPEPPRAPEGAIPEEPPFDATSGAAKPKEKAINIRLDKLNSPDDVINLVRETARDYKGRIQYQRRGRLKDAELKQRMEEVGLDPDKLARLPRGKTLNEAEIEVAIGIMQAEGQKIREAQAEVQKSNTSENILKAQALHNRYVAIQAAVSGITAEAGRALRTFRRIHNAVDREDKTNYERIIDQLGGRPLAEKEAQKLLEIPEEDTIGYYKFLRDHTKFTTAQKLTYYWLNNLLSSPRTPIRKLMGDATMVALNLPKTFVRAAIDPLIARAQRRPTEYHVRDAVAQAGAFFDAIPEGMKRAAFVLKNGFDEEAAEDMDVYRYELPGGYATNFPTRNLAAATVLFKTIHFKSTLAGDAMREALKRGLQGKDAANYAAALFDNPPDEMVSNAMQEAEKLALVERPDSFLRAALRMRNVAIPADYPVVGGFAPLRFVIPFANIGWNIGKTAVRYSPLGAARLGRESVRKGPQASNVLAEALIGSMLLAALAAYASKGNVTGAAPKGAAGEAFYGAGKEPFSIKIAGHWVKYTGAWGVMAPMLSSIAAWFDAYEKNQKLPESKHISQVAATIGAAMTDQPLFRGVQTLMEAITNPTGHTVENFEAEAAAGFVPASSLLRTTAGAIDPAIRDPQGVYERIKAGLPMLSLQVPQRIDALGRPETHRGAEGAKAFLPSAIPEAAPLSSVDAEIARLQELGFRGIPRTGKTVQVQNTPIPLGRAEQAEYQRLRGTLVRKVLEGTFASQEYKALSDEDKIDEVKGLVDEIETYAREEMTARLIERRVGPRAAKKYEPVPRDFEVPDQATETVPQEAP